MYIAIDLGGTNVRIAGSKNLEIGSFDRIEKFQLSHNFEKDYARIVKIIKEISGGKVDAIGMGTPGTFDPEKNFLISARKLQEWVNVPFKEKLIQEFNCPVFLDNDAVVSSLGEVYNQKKNFLYITWGTGIGGANVKWNSGNFSSEKIDWRVYLKIGNCGGKELPLRFNKEITELDESEWMQVMDDFVMNLSKLSEELNEKNIVLGGGATAKQKERLQKVVSELAKKGISLFISNLDDEIGLYGAMALMKINK